MKILKSSCILILISLAVFGQEANFPDRDVYLKIINRRGRPVRNIVVQSVNTGISGLTNRNGLFLFEDMSDNDSISVILSSFGETIIPVAGLDSIVMILRSSNLYSFTNSDGQSVTVEKDKTEPVSLLDVQKMLELNSFKSFIDLLNGRVPGLTIRQNGMSSIGGTSTATIRGPSTLQSSNNEPIVVVDGIILGTINDANAMLNIYDIQSIEVQKGASEWGAQGGNGVIHVKLKK